MHRQTGVCGVGAGREMREGGLGRAIGEVGGPEHSLPRPHQNLEAALGICPFQCSVAYF